MSHVGTSFQTVNVDGKPRILVSSNNHPVGVPSLLPSLQKEHTKHHRAPDYKTRAQRFPLREQIVLLNQDPGPNTNNNMAHSKQINRGRIAAKDEDTITLTSSQLAALLESVGAGRKVSAGGIPGRGKVTQQPHLEKRDLSAPAQARRGNAPASTANHNRPWGAPAPKGARPPQAPPPRSRPAPAANGDRPETLFGLLSKAPKGGNYSKFDSPPNMPSHEDVPRRGRRSPPPRQTDEDAESSSSGPDQAMLDAVMKRVIEENKDKMSEEQLVELLSQVYMQAKQQHKKQNSKHQRHHHPEPEERLEDDNEEEMYRTRPAGRAPPRHEVEALRQWSDDEEHDAHHQSHHHRHQGSPRDAPGGPPIVSPKGKSMLELKRLQWEKEKEEQASLNTYSPWSESQRRAAAHPLKNNANVMELTGLLIGGEEESGGQRRGGGKRMHVQVPSRDDKTPYLPPQLGPQSLVEQNRREKERASAEALANRRSGADHSMATRLVGASEDDRFRQKEAARQQWIAELNAQREEHQQMKKHELQYGTSLKVGDQAYQSAGAARGPQFARGRGLANLEERGAHLASGRPLQQYDEPEEDGRYARKHGGGGKMAQRPPAQQDAPPWLR